MLSILNNCTLEKNMQTSFGDIPHTVIIFNLQNPCVRIIARVPRNKSCRSLLKNIEYFQYQPYTYWSC